MIGGGALIPREFSRPRSFVSPSVRSLSSGRLAFSVFGELLEKSDPDRGVVFLLLVGDRVDPSQKLLVCGERLFAVTHSIKADCKKIVCHSQIGTSLDKPDEFRRRSRVLFQFEQRRSHIGVRLIIVRLVFQHIGQQRKSLGELPRSYERGCQLHPHGVVGRFERQCPPIELDRAIRLDRRVNVSREDQQVDVVWIWSDEQLDFAQRLFGVLERNQDPDDLHSQRDVIGLLGCKLAIDSHRRFGLAHAGVQRSERSRAIGRGLRAIRPRELFDCLRKVAACRENAAASFAGGRLVRAQLNGSRISNERVGLMSLTLLRHTEERVRQRSCLALLYRRAKLVGGASVLVRLYQRARQINPDAAQFRLELYRALELALRFIRQAAIEQDLAEPPVCPGKVRRQLNDFSEIGFCLGGFVQRDVSDGPLVMYLMERWIECYRTGIEPYRSGNVAAFLRGLTFLKQRDGSGLIVRRQGTRLGWRPCRASDHYDD